MPEQLPPAVRLLLSRHIRSVEQLEVLLLLHSQPARSWGAREVYEVVRSSESSVTERLSAFTKLGFFAEESSSPPTFRYAPQDQALRAVVDETATAYRTWRIRVIEAIFAPEVDPVQSFADAFKLRKD